MDESLDRCSAHDWGSQRWLRRANSCFEQGDYRSALRGYVLSQAARLRFNAALQSSIERTIERLFSKHTPHRDRLWVPQCPEPLVTVVVPVYRQWESTAACLSAIADHSGAVPIEVLALDDASGAATRERLLQVQGLRIVTQVRNRGFLENCNLGCEVAEGKYLVFLNNDTLVQPGWLEALLRVIRQQPRVGAVGAQLRYADGRLQELGGIVWRDGSASRVGDGEWEAPCFCSGPRDVDYCSAAALLLSKQLWQRLDGFDQRYAPAYYEDTDLCFRIREAGLRVMVQPESQVIHLDGVSHGSQERQQKIEHNRRIFERRWRSVLQQQHGPVGSDPIWAAERAQARPMVVVADHKLPEPDRDAGSRSMLHLIRALVGAGVLVKFWAHSTARDPHYLRQLEAEGIEVLSHLVAPEELACWLRLQRSVLDWVLLSRPDVAQVVLEAVGNGTTFRFAYYGHDLHSQRLERQAVVDADPWAALEAARIGAVEQHIWKTVQLIYYPAADEVLAVREQLGYHDCADVRQLPVFAYPNEELSFEREQPPRPPNLLMVAGFAHPPNTAAALWFVREVFPLVRVRCPGVKISLVGSHPPQEIEALRSDSVVVSGCVSDVELEEHYHAARVCVAPIRYGAGVNGKIVEALRFGVPCVTTAAGARGFVQPQQALLVADAPRQFAQACLHLLQDDEHWQVMAMRATEYVANYFSLSRMQEALNPLIQVE